MGFKTTPLFLFTMAWDSVSGRTQIKFGHFNPGLLLDLTLQENISMVF